MEGLWSSWKSCNVWTITKCRSFLGVVLLFYGLTSVSRRFVLLLLLWSCLIRFFCKPLESFGDHELLFHRITVGVHQLMMSPPWKVFHIFLIGMNDKNVVLLFVPFSCFGDVCYSIWFSIQTKYPSWSVKKRIRKWLAGEKVCLCVGGFLLVLWNDNYD